MNSDYTTAGVPSSGIVSSAIGTGTLIFNGGTLQAGGADFSIANAGQITSLGGTIDANGQTFTLAGAISDNATVEGRHAEYSSTARAAAPSCSAAPIPIRAIRLSAATATR